MTKKFEIETSTLGKAFFFLILLILLSFFLGLHLGHDDSSSSSLNTDSDKVKEHMNACSYKIQEITSKYSALKKLAEEKGIIDKDGAIITSIKCLATPEPIPSEPTKKEDKKDPKTLKKASKIVKKQKRRDKKPEQKNSVTKADVKKASKKTTKKVSSKPVKTKSQDLNDMWKVIDKVSINTENKKNTKNQAEKAIDESSSKKCRFAIQVFSGRSKEEALKAKKNFNLSGTRLVSGMVGGNKWHRIRYGCYSNRKMAENDLVNVKSKVKTAIVVKN